MPIVRECSTPGCSTLTIGINCMDHEQPLRAGVTFPRGNPLTLVPDVSGLERGREFRLHEADTVEDAPSPA
jgi:hypothetical protein